MNEVKYKIYRVIQNEDSKEMQVYANCIWRDTSMEISIIDENGEYKPTAIDMNAAQHDVFAFAVKCHAEGQYYSNAEIEEQKLLPYKAATISSRKNEIKNNFRTAGIELFADKRGLIISDEWFIETFTYSLSSFFKKQNIVKQTVSRLHLSYKCEWETVIEIGTENCQEMIEKTFLSSSASYCSLIIGDGGAGKTNLLKILNIVFTADKMNVYTISLAHLLLFSHSHVIHNPVSDVVDSGGLETDRYNSYLAQYLKFQTFPSDGAVFLLDGFNEMLDMVTNENGGIIERICEEISELCRKKVYRVIISARNAKITTTRLPNIEFTLYRPDPLDVEIDPAQLPDISDAEKQHLLSMLRTPLFYNMYRSLFKDEKLPDTQYGIMKRFFLKLFDQSVRKKDGQDGFESRCLYFLLLPFIAHKMHVKSLPFLSYAELRNYISQMNENTSDYVDWINFCTQEMGIPTILVKPDSLNVAEAMADAAIHTSLIEYDETENALRFIHQEWHEFLSAFYVISYLRLQKKLYASKYNISGRLASKLMMPSFNLPSSVQKTVGVELNLLPASDKNTEEVNEARADAYSAFFAVDAENNNQTLERIQDSMTLLFTAYELSDHFMLHHWNAPQKIAGPFFREIIQPNASPELFSDDTMKIRYCKSLAALMESDRRKKQYAEIQTIYDTAMNKFGIEQYRDSKIGEEMLTYCILFHQLAKASLFEGKDMIVNATTCAERKKGRQRIHEAMTMLQDNSAFNMSANLLGCMYATPNQFLIRELDKQPDVQKAAETYAKSFSAMTSKALTRLIGTELLYTGRSYLNLLLKTFVRWDGKEWQTNDALLLPTEENKDENENTFTKAKLILEHLEGQDTSFLNWDRAMFRIFKAAAGDAVQTELYEADAFLLSEKYNIMTAAVRLSGLLEAVYSPDEQPSSETIFFAVEKDKVTYDYTDREEAESALKAELEKKDKEVGTATAFDATDQYYYLQDLERLCLVLKKMSKKCSRIQTAPLNRILETLDTIENYKSFKNLLASK